MSFSCRKYNILYYIYFMLKTFLKYATLISIFCCTFTMNLQAQQLNQNESNFSNVFSWDCEARILVGLCTCRFSSYRAHTSHSRTADYIEPKPKRDSKVITQQFANQIQAMSTTRNLVAILYWSKLTDSLAYGVAAKDSLNCKDLEKGKMA